MGRKRERYLAARIRTDEAALEMTGAQGGSTQDALSRAQHNFSEERHNTDELWSEYQQDPEG